MKTLFPLFVLAVLILAACSSKEKDYESLQQSRVSFDENLSVPFDDIESARALADQYEAFIEKYPRDERIPVLTVELAGIYSNYLGDQEQAINYFLKVYEEYPDSKHAPMSLIAVAEIFHDRLEKYEKAKTYYTKFIEEYPGHEMTKDVKVLLEHIGKSPEQILESIRKKGVIEEVDTNLNI